MKTTVKEKTETIKSFVDYFVEKSKIDTKELQCIRTYGWGDKAVIRVEYADSQKDYKPIVMAKKYLFETYGYYPENLNFSNAHYDRIGSSCLYVYDVNKDDFNNFSEMPTVVCSNYKEHEDWGSIEFVIHNKKQMELSYEGRLFEYFKNKKTYENENTN